MYDIKLKFVYEGTLLSPLPVKRSYELNQRENSWRAFIIDTIVNLRIYRSAMRDSVF